MNINSILLVGSSVYFASRIKFLPSSPPFVMRLSKFVAEKGLLIVSFVQGVIHEIVYRRLVSPAMLPHEAIRINCYTVCRSSDPGRTCRWGCLYLRVTPYNCTLCGEIVLQRRKNGRYSGHPQPKFRNIHHIEVLGFCTHHQQLQLNFPRSYKPTTQPDTKSTKKDRVKSAFK